MDPTAPDVTLGHAVPLKIIRQFQDWGHKAVLIIGDYTARVGDPSGRNKTRPMLSGEEIDANAKTTSPRSAKSSSPIPRILKMRFNGEWLAKMNSSTYRTRRPDERRADARARRLRQSLHEGTDIRLHEFLYPLIQG